MSLLYHPISTAQIIHIHPRYPTLTHHNFLPPHTILNNNNNNNDNDNNDNNLIQYENYYNHCYTPSDSSMTWQLDYDKTNDFDDVAGHWHVEDHPKKAGACRVFYACDVAFKQSLPKPVMSFVSKSALKQATGWVKRESEGKKDGVVSEQFLPVAE